MASRRTTKKTRKYKQDLYMEQQIKAIVVMGVSAFLFAGLKLTEQTGLIGSLLDLIFRFLLGDAAILLPFFLVLASAAYLWPRKIKNMGKRLLGLTMIFLLITMILHLRAAMPEVEGLTGTGPYAQVLLLGLGGAGGGLVGALLFSSFYFLFRDVGSYIVAVVLALVAFLMITNRSMAQFLTAGLDAAKFLSQKLGALIQGLSTHRVTKRRAKTPTRVALDHEPLEITVQAEEILPPYRGRERPEKPRENNHLHPQQQQIAPPAHSGAATPESTAREKGAVPRGATAPEEENNGASSAQLEQLTAASASFHAYEPPPLELLTRVHRLRDQQQHKITQERAKALEATFASFGVKVKIKEVQSGPAVTRFEIQPETGVKVSKILSLSDDLALNLAASDVRIEAPIPGKQAIGIEVPNKIVSLVYLREVLENSDFYNFSSPLVAGLGKDITGVPVFADLLKMPHLLIAGSTGSGKSVCINAIICSILLRAHPGDIKFLMIDPKVVELNVYNGIPHLISPVITQPKKASLALKSMTKEMERRYALFAQEGVRDILKYNELIRNNGDKNNGDVEGNPLPFIIVLIDELADLMMVAPAEVEDSIVRLSQMSRAAGIHLVIATQRPSVDVITGLIKANITSRIAFAVSSATDSRTILDLGGAEKLLGRGDMLYYPVGSSKPQRIQGAFLSEQDIFKVVEYIKQQQGPVVEQSFFAEEDREELAPREELDPLLPEVVELVLLSGQASISLIQRRFRVGYTRAARLMDDMERLGIAGPYEGSKPRQVLVTQERATEIIKEKFDGV